MFKSWRLGTLFGFPIELNASFLILLAFVFVAFGGLAGVMIVGIAFASVLLHELGHAVVARRLGVRISGIELGFLGGAAKMEDLPRTARHEIAIAAAGPIVSLLLGGASLGLAFLVNAPLLATIGWINLVLAAFNLIPALPMDGGRILRAALATRMSFVRATDASITVARVVAVGFGILGLMGAYQLLILAPFLWFMGSRERQMARMVQDHYGGYPGGGGRRGGGLRRDAVEVLGRDAWDRRAHEPALPRFRIRQQGGRLVIEALD